MIISTVNLEGKGRKIAKTKNKKTTKKTRKGFEKKLLLTISKVNFEGKGGKIAKTKKKKKTKRVGEKAPAGISQGPRTIFEAKERNMKMPKGGTTGMRKHEKLNGDKKGMIIFNPKNDDQNEKHEQNKKT